MNLNVHLEVDLVAVEQADRIALLLELGAPAAEQSAPRPPAAVRVILGL